MKQDKISFAQGELVATARGLLSIHIGINDRRDAAAQAALIAQFKRFEDELARLIHNQFQTHSSELGDTVQLALLILLMNGERHILGTSN
jgi:hypothetical protein